MPGLRSLRNRLAVIFALIILGAIGTIYLSVTPRLEASLTAQTLDRVRATSAQRTPEIAPFLYPPRELYPERTRSRRHEDGGSTRPDPGRPRAPTCAGSPSGSAPR